MAFGVVRKCHARTNDPFIDTRSMRNKLIPFFGMRRRGVLGHLNAPSNEPVPHACLMSSRRAQHGCGMQLRCSALVDAV